MSVCYNCFNEIGDAGVCPYCGYDAAAERSKYALALPYGSVLAGKYIIGRVLGQGGFGITYVAEDYTQKKLVAIKEYFPDSLAARTQGKSVSLISSDREENYRYGMECFLAEAKTLAAFIGNPNIVRVYSYFEENNTAYFAMEYIQGVSLKSRLKSRGGKIPYEEACGILLPVMDALAAVHAKGIIHRDISPDNIYITNEGSVKLIDFGAARYSMGDRSRSLDVVLKHGYAPKEQYTRRGRQGPFTDVYAFAATFYHAITGRIPPDSIDRIEEDDLIPPSVLGCSLPESAEDALLKALSVSASDRYRTMEQFKADLTAGETPPVQPAVEETPPAGDDPASVPPPEEEQKIPAAAVPIAATAVSLIPEEHSVRDSFAEKNPPQAAAASVSPESEVNPVQESYVAENPIQDSFAAETPPEAAVSEVEPIKTSIQTEEKTAPPKRKIRPAALLAAAGVAAAVIILLIVLLPKGGSSADVVSERGGDQTATEASGRGETDTPDPSTGKNAAVIPGDSTADTPTQPVTQKPTTPPATQKPTTPPATQKPTSPPATQKPTSPPATQKPTSPPATQKPTSPPPSNRVKIIADGTSYTLNTGDVFTYTYYLCTDETVCALQATTDYQSGGLELLSDIYDEWSVFPIIGNDITAYEPSVGIINYNFTNIRQPKNFSGWNSIMITLRFRVTAKSGTASVSTSLLYLLGGPDADSLIYNGAIQYGVLRSESVIY